MSATSSTTLQDLGAALGLSQPLPPLLRQALTHRSHSATHNERLEFLGDAVLNLCISHWLMERLPQASEGELSRTRASLVKEQTLHRIALRLPLSGALLLGEGERKTGGQERPSILADAVEAVIGAVYLQGGFAAAQRLVDRLFDQVDLTETAAKAKDAKTGLQEWLQARRIELPGYELAEVRGADHQQVFVVVGHVPKLQLSGRGEGRSRKAAEQQAAQHLLDQLQAGAATRPGGSRAASGRARSTAAVGSARRAEPGRRSPVQAAPPNPGAQTHPDKGSMK